MRVAIEQKQGKPTDSNKLANMFFVFF